MNDEDAAGIASTVGVIIVIYWIVYLIVCVFRSFFVLLSYFFTNFLYTLLLNILVFAVPTFVYVLIPLSLLYLSVIVFLRLEISIKGSQNRIPLLPNRVFWRGLLKGENYYRQRIIILILLVVLIITGLSLGWVTKDRILKYREKFSFYKTPCGDNSSKIDQNLHQVFVNKNDEETLKYLQKNYCQYAARKYRKDQNQLSIQL